MAGPRSPPARRGWIAAAIDGAFVEALELTFDDWAIAGRWLAGRWTDAIAWVRPRTLAAAAGALLFGAFPKHEHAHVSRAKQAAKAPHRKPVAERRDQQEH